MTINAFIDRIVEKNPEQIITIYNRNHNIEYHGKADFAPLNCYDEYANSYERTVTGIDGNPVTDIVINDTVETEPAEETEPAKKYIAVVHEKGEYDDHVKYEFDTLEELRDFMKIMSGVLIATDVHSKTIRKSHRG